MHDTSISAAVIIFLICHLATITIGCKTQKTTLLISYLNVIVVIGVFLFWMIYTLNIKKHIFEFRALFVIGMEACILIFALFYIIGFHKKTYVKVINYIGFGVHLLIATGMLYYISTFKIDKLF